MRSLRILFFLMLFPFLSGCGITRQTAQEQDEMVQAIRKPDILLQITQIIPSGFPSRTSTGEFTLRLKGDVVNTRLPYAGRTSSLSFSADDISIVFENEEVELEKDFSDADRKGEYRYSFKGGKGIDKWTVRLQLFDNGRAYVKCMSENGRNMEYVADITIPASEDE